MNTDFDTIFDCAPTSYWLEDFSGLHAIFEEWRAAGVTDLRRHLNEDRARITECMLRLRILRVNRKTLQLYEARDQAHLIAQIDRVLGDPVESQIVEVLAALWNGDLGFSTQAVNLSLGGQRLDILVNVQVLPGHEARWDRALVAIEDISQRTRAEARLRESEHYARGIFEHSPVSLWVEDLSGIKRLLDALRSQGIDDFRAYTEAHPEFTLRCIGEIRVIDVNQYTLDMFRAGSKAMLLENLHTVFRDEMQATFTEMLIDLWDGRMSHHEVVNYRLDGEPIHVLLHCSVLPGSEQDWHRAQIALIDITARKQAEAHLAYASSHDALTKLRNRAFLEVELHRLERTGPWPVTAVAIDLNQLKAANDEGGHAAGDALLRRAGEVLAEAAEWPCSAARIGGDEFVMLLPGRDESAGLAMIERIGALVDANTRACPGRPLSLSMGCASADRGERLEAALGRADQQMYAAKSRFYAARGIDRRH